MSNKKMEDSRMIAQIILEAPSQYSVPINVIQTNLKTSQGVTLSEVKSLLRDFWKTNLKDKKKSVKSSRNVAFNATCQSSKKPLKKFTGSAKTVENKVIII